MKNNKISILFSLFLSVFMFVSCTDDALEVWTAKTVDFNGYWIATLDNGETSEEIEIIISNTAADDENILITIISDEFGIAMRTKAATDIANLTFSGDKVVNGQIIKDGFSMPQIDWIFDDDNAVSTHPIELTDAKPIVADSLYFEIPTETYGTIKVTGHRRTGWEDYID